MGGAIVRDPEHAPSGRVNVRLTLDGGAVRNRVSKRERRARLLGVAVALAVMVAASLTIRWPAPAIAAAIGFGAYFLARGRRD